MTSRRRASSRAIWKWPVRRGLLAAAGIAALLRLASLSREPAQPPRAADPAAVHRVVDGDTLLMATGTRVRLLGVDCPEIRHADAPAEPWADDATAFTRQAIGDHPVRFEYDRERLDRYGRLLAWVWIDDRLLNLELVRAGLGRAEVRYPIRTDYRRRLEQAQAEAEQAGRGMWSEPRQADLRADGPPPIVRRSSESTGAARRSGGR